MTSADVVVIGGGLHGCSTALHCARAGLKVTVLEREAVGRHASGVNAGGVRQVGRHYSEVPLSALSVKMWHSIADLVDDDCGFQQSGHIMVAANEQQLGDIRQRVAKLRSMGFEHEEVVEPDDMYDILPALKRGLPGALMSREDGFANPYRTTTAFRRKAESLGVTILQGRPATGLKKKGSGFVVETAQGPLHAGAVVNCSGAWSAELCDWMGEPVPLQPIAPMMTITAPMPHFVSPVVGYSGKPLSFKQYANGNVMIGGGYSGIPDLKTGLTRLRYDLLSENLATAMDVFPIMAQARIVRQWAGIEAQMPDHIPVLGASSTTEGLFHAFGFSAHGFQLGPVIGLLISELIQGKSSQLPLDDFHISRFRGWNGSAEPEHSIE